MDKLEKKRDKNINKLIKSASVGSQQVPHNLLQDFVYPSPCVTLGWAGGTGKREKEYFISLTSYVHFEWNLSTKMEIKNLFE